MTRTLQIAPEDGDGRLVARVTTGTVEGRSPILYLHGFGSSQDGDKAEFFRARAASAGLGFVSFDLQGHGLSDGGMRGLTLTRCLRDVERVRRSVPEVGGPISMMGSSMGALVALWHAAAVAGSARAVETMALIAPALGLAASLRQLLGDEGMDRWRRDGVLEVTNELGSYDLGWGFVDDLERFDSSRLAARHRSPVLVFQGKLDDRVRWRDVAEFARATGRLTRLELFEDGDHRLLDRIDWIWQETLAFLGGATPPAART